MQVLKDYIKSQSMFQRVELQNGEEHELVLIDAKVSTIKDALTKENIEGIKLLVKEGEKMKTIFTASASLICGLADIEPNETFKVQKVEYEGNLGQVLNRYDVWRKIGEEFVLVEEPAEEVE